MKPFENILVCVGDRGEAEIAARRAAVVARGHGASLTLLAITDELPSFVRNLVPGARERAVERHRRDVQRRLEQLAERFVEQDLRVALRLREGALADVVLAEIERGGHDLVVKTSRQRFSQGHEFLGEADWELMRRSPVPVWLVDPTHRGAETLLVAIDPDLTDARRAPLRHELLALAASVARLGSADVHVATVLPAADAGDAEREAGVRDAIAALVRQAGLRAAPDRLHVLYGEPEQRVADLVAARHVDVLVIGTLSKATGAASRRMGHTAETIVRAVRCSIITARPERAAQRHEPPDGGPHAGPLPADGHAPKTAAPAVR